MADTEIGTAYGITTLPHLRSLNIIGPHRRDRRVRHGEPPPDLHLPAAIAREEGAVRRRDRPAAGARARSAARSPIATSRLMAFYARGRADRNFEYGIAKTLEAILASPQFVFRIEETSGAASRARASGWTTTSSRRGCRSSCGASGRTTSC